MSFTRFISNREAMQHGLVHPRQAIGMINSRITPWIICECDVQNRASGGMNLAFRLFDRSKRGAMRKNEEGEMERAYGIDVAFPINDILPTKEELNVIVEYIRQDLGLKSKVKIIT